MNMTEYIANAIIGKYDRKAVELLSDKDKFLNVLTGEYNRINEIRLKGNVGMIVNPDVLISTLLMDFKNTEELKKKTAECIVKNLYFKNIINKEEYDNLCKKEM